MRTAGFLLSLILLSACATIIPPDGGPVDTQAPQILKENPANRSTNQTSKTIRLEFDEYLTVTDPQNNITVNPTPQVPPYFEAKGKTVIVHLKDTLLPNTTYQLQFKKAVVDQKEATALEAYSYVFSTGNSLDTNQLTGTVLSQTDEKPLGGITVGLYPRWKDSLPYSTKPMYSTKTRENGTYQLQYIAEGQYYALFWKDDNNNLLLDKEEDLAFRPKAGRLKDSINLAPFYLWSSKPISKSISSQTPVSEKRWELTTQNTGWVKGVKSNVPLDWKQDSTTYSLSLINKTGADSFKLTVLFDSLQADTFQLKSKTLSAKDSLVKWTISHIDYPAIALRPDREIQIKNMKSIEIWNKQEELFQPFTASWDSSRFYLWITPLEMNDDAQLEITLFKDLTREAVKDSLKLGIDYGDPMQFPAMTFTWDSFPKPIVIQLIMDEKVVKQFHHNGEKDSWHLPVVMAGKYTLKVFEDPNQNGIQDPGSLFPYKKEEQLIYLNNNVFVQIGWDNADFPLVWKTRE